MHRWLWRRYRGHGRNKNRSRISSRHSSLINYQLHCDRVLHAVRHGCAAHCHLAWTHGLARSTQLRVLLEFTGHPHHWWVWTATTLTSVNSRYSVMFFDYLFQLFASCQTGLWGLIIQMYLKEDLINTASIEHYIIWLSSTDWRKAEFAVMFLESMWFNV